MRNSSSSRAPRNGSWEQPVQEPARLFRLAAVEAGAKDPEPASLYILHPKIVPRRRARPAPPTFGSDALGTFGAADLVQHPTPADRIGGPSGTSAKVSIGCGGLKIRRGCKGGSPPSAADQG